MITTPLAKHEELAYELLRWYRSATYTITEARVDATAVIVALLAATPYDFTWTVTNHPLTEWLRSTFFVDWRRASQGLAVL